MTTGRVTRHARSPGKLRPAWALVRQCQDGPEYQWLYECFPVGTRVNDPQGGSVLWIELPKGVDGSDLFQKALENDISIAPGVLFSLGSKYSRFIRVSFGVQWSQTVEEAFKTLATLAHGEH